MKTVKVWIESALEKNDLGGLKLKVEVAVDVDDDQFLEERRPSLYIFSMSNLILIEGFSRPQLLGLGPLGD